MGEALGMLLVLLLLPTASEAYWSVDYTITGARTSWTADTIPGLGLPSYTSYTFSAGPASVQADACLPGYYSNDDALTCIACPSGKYSSTPTASSVDTCIACESGKYSGTVGANSSSTCLNCPNATYFAGTAGTSLAVCLACPANSSSYPGSKLLQACVCNGGWSGSNGGTCTACNISTFCLYGQANPCPPNSKSPPRSSSLGDCKCIASFYGDTTQGSAELTLCQVQMCLFLIFTGESRDV